MALGLYEIKFIEIYEKMGARKRLLKSFASAGFDFV